MIHHVLITAPQREFKAQLMLAGHAAEIIIPLEHRLKRVNSKDAAKVCQAYPMFPRYLFVGFDWEPSWYDLSRLEFGDGKRVIAARLEMDGRPYEIDPLAMVQIRQLHSFAHLPEIRLSRGLKVGDTVIIEGGRFDGQRVKVKRTKGRHVAIALMKFFGQLREVELPVKQLRRVA